MKEFSKEIINIDGVDYTLFINRKGILSWEKIAEVQKREKTYSEKVSEALKTNDFEIKDGDNPFEISGAEALIEAEEEAKTIYKKLFWIALYENHKLNYKDVVVLFDKASEEYGVDSVIELLHQMIDDANTNRIGKNELKKLPALRPKKN